MFYASTAGTLCEWHLYPWKISPLGTHRTSFSAKARFGRKRVGADSEHAATVYIKHNFSCVQNLAHCKSIYNYQVKHWIRCNWFRCNTFGSESRGCWFNPRWQHSFAFFFCIFFGIFLLHECNRSAPALRVGLVPGRITAGTPSCFDVSGGHRIYGRYVPPPLHSMLGLHDTKLRQWAYLY